MFCYTNPHKTMSVRAWPIVTPGTWFEQTWISWFYRCSMRNILTFGAAVFEKIIF